MLSIIQVTTTCDDEQKAEALARALVEQRLAACVQIDGPIKSVYRWNGKVEVEREWRCTIKTKKEHLLELQNAIYVPACRENSSLFDPSFVSRIVFRITELSGDFCFSNWSHQVRKIKFIFLAAVLGGCADAARANFLAAVS